MSRATKHSGIKKSKTKVPDLTLTLPNLLGRSIRAMLLKYSTLLSNQRLHDP